VTLPVQPLVVLGVGNVLLSDDAVGVRVIEGLRGVAQHDPQALPPDTRLVDGGTLGLDLLRIVRDARGLVLVDAVRFGAPAGTVAVLHGDAIVSAGGARDGQATSAVGELIAVARLMAWLPEPVALVGIEISDTAFGANLSPAVADALPVAIDAVRAELRRMDERSGTASTGGVVAGPVAGATA
jgi:hydrogenase maturation protease